MHRDSLLRRTRARVLVVLALCASLGFSCSSKPPEAAQAPAQPAQSGGPAAQQASGAQPVVAALSSEQKHGAELYARICKVCHGAEGEGYKADRAPALAHPDFLASVTDDFMRIAIAEGRTGTTMSAWSVARGGPLGPKDIVAIIAFIRSWQKKPRAQLDESPLRGNATRALPVYARECVRCHGERGIGGQYIRIGDPVLLRTASDGFLRFAIAHGRPGTEMQEFQSKLGASGVEDMVALVRSFEHPILPGAQPQVSANRPLALPPPPRLTAPLPLGRLPLNPHGPEPKGFEVYPKTTPAEVVYKQLQRHARMALLDARAPADYVFEHIKGAVSVPFYDPSPYLDKLPKDVWLVSYCACPHAESGELAQKLLDHGFTKVTVLAEGIGFWKNAGHKLSKGKKP